MKSTLTKHGSAFTTWAVLVIGILIIFATSLFIFSIYFDRNRFEIRRGPLTREIISAVTLAQALPLDKVKSNINLLRGRGIHLSITDTPALHAKILTLTTPTVLRLMVEQDPTNVHLSIPLHNTLWLNIYGRVKYMGVWFIVGLAASIVLLFIALLILCTWAIKRLTLPAASLVKAVENFGLDVQAPPIALQGSKETQAVIRAFNIMQSRIRKLLHDRTQMLAAISHDLRTPITRLQLRAEYLQGTEQYEKVLADLREMEAMISAILAFARESFMEEAMEWFDINALLESLCNDLVDAGMEVNFTEDKQRIRYYGRLNALKRAISNLIENGVKYGNKVMVEWCSTQQTIQIKIADEGPGIPETEMQKVFEPFYRVDQARTPKKPGTGLGMALARDIILAHGGDISLFNRKPRGLLVIITLPIQSEN